MPARTQPSRPGRRYASLQDGADYISASVKHVRRMMDRGEINAYRSGRLLRIDLDELDAALAQHTDQYGGAA